ncbi:MAG: amidohydrolase [Saprospiraceae bacterium]|nr:amidohydrolase [Saprospiraceae bacterium]
MRCLTFLFFILIWTVPIGGQTYYELEDYRSVPKIDVHVHISVQRLAFALAAADQNFRLVNIVVDGAGTWKRIREQWKYVHFQKDVHPRLFQPITAFSVEDFHEEDWESRTIAWLDSCFAEGALGVKVWKNIGMVLKDQDGSNVMLDDDRLDRIFQHIIEADKLEVGHLGEPLNCWLPLDSMSTNNDRSYFSEHPEYHMFLHPELPSYQDQMDARNRRLDKHSEIKFMGAHMASIEWSVAELGAWLDRYPNATIDLAARMGQVFSQTVGNREGVRDFFIRYADRIMYATDLGDRMTNTSEELAEYLEKTWMRDWRYFVTDQMMESDLINSPFQGLKLPKNIVDKILHDTAEAFFSFDTE